MNRLEREERLDNLLAELGAAWMLSAAESPERRRAARRLSLAGWVLDQLESETRDGRSVAPIRSTG